MAKKTINLGSGDSRGDGESIRTAFDKCNDNFDELYADISTLDGSKIVYGDLSVATASASGAGSLAYNSLTGVFTFTPAAAVGNIFDQDLNTTDAVQFTDLTLDATLTFDNGTRTWVTNVTDDTIVGGAGNNTILLMEPNGLNYNAIAPNNTRIDLGVDPSIDVGGSLQWGNIYLDTTSAITFGDSTTQTTAWTGTITESQISDLQNYLTSYTVTEADVTAHEGALTITESQISDLTHFSGSYNDLTNKPDLTDYATIAQGVQGAAAFSWGDHSTAGYLRSVSEAAVTAHQAALTITESQISDLGTYVESDTTGITGADQVSNIVTLTQAEYDAIGTPNASTVYIIVG
jgi:hypothetical protein